MQWLEAYANGVDAVTFFVLVYFMLLLEMLNVVFFRASIVEKLINLDY